MQASPFEASTFKLTKFLLSISSNHKYVFSDQRQSYGISAYKYYIAASETCMTFISPIDARPKTFVKNIPGQNFLYYTI